MTADPDSPFQPIPILLADAFLKQKIEQRKLIFAQPFLGGASLLGIEAGRECH